ncbi:MAG: hypothetical protein K2X82_09975 [Gemmataceae bacterium]|nr:hypothetical protein [Gemmataceae bacterium]
MAARRLLLLYGSGVVLAVAVAPVGRPNDPPASPREAPGLRPARPNPSAEDLLIAELNSPGLPPQRVIQVIGTLKMFGRSPRVVRELLNWYHFNGRYYTKPLKGRSPLGSVISDGDRTSVRRDHPAVVALLEIRSQAMPTLVEEYVAMHARGAAKPGGHEARRLNTAVIVLSYTHGTAEAAIHYATRYAAERPDDPAVRAACAELVETIMQQVPGYTSAFPGVVVPP